MPTNIKNPDIQTGLCPNHAGKSRLPIPVMIMPEKATTKIKNTLKNMILSSESSSSAIAVPRMTRSSSLRRANSLRRFNKHSDNNLNVPGNPGNPGNPGLVRSGTGGSLERYGRRSARGRTR